MKCIACDSEKFECQNIKHSPAVKKEPIEVTIPTHVCKQCGRYQLDTNQVDLLRLKSVDAYRKKHNLLTSENIIALRLSLGMSQIAFAEYLNVDPSLIKEWETYFIQDPIHDDLIRKKSASLCH